MLLHTLKALFMILQAVNQHNDIFSKLFSRQEPLRQVINRLTIEDSKIFKLTKIYFNK